MTNNTYYHIEGQPKKSKKLWLLVFIPIFMVMIGGYYFILTQSPNLKVGAAPNEQTEKQYQEQETNYIKIPKINLLVKLSDGDGSVALENGAWHRLPERGDPTKEGNFIICANRLKLGLTPGATKAKSPFFHLNKLAEEDMITVFYNGREYTYKVTELKTITVGSTEPENPSDIAKLTLYSCESNGASEGTVAVEALPTFSTTGSDQPTGETPLL